LEIRENPFHKGTVKIESYNNIRRKRVGEYRILYTIESQKKEVLIVKIELRSETTYK
jgi:mRNA-degrading endonuclease RelE of RelBE toxin-antitoxin system